MALSDRLTFGAATGKEFGGRELRARTGFSCPVAYFMFVYSRPATWLIWILEERNVKHKQSQHILNEGNVLFNDALNTFYVWLYGVRHMVQDHSDSEIEERERCFI